MKSVITCSAALLFLVFSSSVVTAEKPAEPQPKPEEITLSGKLIRPIKWSPQLELIPAGVNKHIDLRGKLLNNIEAGTYLKVRGVVKSYLHRGGTKDNPSPFPAQWTIWLDVTHVETLENPLDVLKEETVSTK